MEKKEISKPYNLYSFLYRVLIKKIKSDNISPAGSIEQINGIVKLLPTQIPSPFQK